MGAQLSKDEMLYNQVRYGNIEGIRALRSHGAGLEWFDKDGKTPLIVACLRHDLLPAAKVLIEMGADVNTYRPGHHAGTPLHHAAKRGYEQTVHFLLSKGANPFILNDDCHSALDMAREKGHLNVVRAIESRISIFSGWLREAYGPSFLEAFAPQLMMRKIWAVVLPCDIRNPTRPIKFELRIYPDLQTARPCISIPLWKAQIDAPKFSQVDPAIIIVDKATRARYKLLSEREGDKQQLQWFLYACQGNSQVTVVTDTPTATSMSNLYHITPNTSAPAAATSEPTQEDLDLAMAINASIQTAIAEGVPRIPPSPQTNNMNGWGSSSGDASYNGWVPQNLDPQKTNNQVPLAESTTTNGWIVPEVQSNSSTSQPNVENPITPVMESSTAPAPAPAPAPAQLVPSAPPIADDIFLDGPIQYPSIDFSPVDMSMPAVETAPVTVESKDGATPSFSKPESGGNDGCCVICLDAPVEGACIPCGHMVGCMSCLKEIEGKKWGCPVCRAKIDQVIRLYAV